MTYVWYREVTSADAISQGDILEDHGLARARASDRGQHRVLHAAVRRGPRRLRAAAEHRDRAGPRPPLAAYFVWSAWAAATDRPGESITYTSNWPHEPLIANRPTSDAVVWTGVSILMLLAGIGGLGFWHAARRKEDGPAALPSADPMLGASPTPSQLATVKYFWVVCGLFVLQILPYSVVRTWHVQLGIFWIATAWLAAGLAIAFVVAVARLTLGRARGRAKSGADLDAAISV